MGKGVIRMKKLLAFILAFAMALSLAACGGGRRGEEAPGPDEPDDPVPQDPVDPAPGEDDPEPPINAPRFTKEELPRLDGSTSTAPLAISMVAMMLGISEDEASTLISFSRTTNSYYNLLYDSADLLIVSEGNEEVYTAREEMGFSWEQTPFAIDAFVFVVNENNPVESITVDQARRIYTGEIKNWSELGGADQEIIPLQRNPEAGSQSLMEKLVMQGTPMMDPPKEYVAESMGGLMEAVRGYDSSAGAIGYSVYYYAEEMRAAEGLKLLRIDGVEPEPDAIRSGAYPLTNPYYVVIPSSAPEGSPTRIIRDWLLGENGQRLAAREGYVSVMSFPTKPKETLPTVGTRLFEEYTDELVPGNYGSLVPFAGLRVSDSEFAVSGCLYGLMTPRGQVVVDPVYSDVWFSGELVVLSRAFDGVERVAVAAKSGAWCTDFEYRAATGGREGVVLFRDNNVTLIRSTGETEGTYTPADLGITKEQFDLMCLGPVEGGGGEWLGDKVSVGYEFKDDEATVLYFDLKSHTLKRTDTETWASFYPDDSPRQPIVEDSWYIFDSSLGEDAPAILCLTDWNENSNFGVYTYYYEDGTPIPSLTSNVYCPVRLIHGLIEKLEANMATYYDLNTLQVVFRTYLGFEGD